MPDKLPAMHPELREIFRVVYQYRQKYQHPTSEREFWMAAAKEMSATAARLKDHPFARAMLLCCYEDIQRELDEHKPPEQTRCL